MSLTDSTFRAWKTFSVLKQTLSSTMLKAIALFYLTSAIPLICRRSQHMDLLTMSVGLVALILGAAIGWLLGWLLARSRFTTTIAELSTNLVLERRANADKLANMKETFASLSGDALRQNNETPVFAVRGRTHCDHLPSAAVARDAAGSGQGYFR
jgi:ribose/xylose/arabinose/galactoside ABC-type transport system permease subunit